MILKTFKSDNLDIKVFDTRNDMGKAAAADVVVTHKAHRAFELEQRKP